MLSTMNIHGVTRIEAVTEKLGKSPSKFNTTQISFYAQDGSKTVITAFTGAYVLPIEGADHINHVASGEVPV